MLSLFRSRTKFERTLFYIIVLISLILGSISVLSLVVAQRKFENLLQELWSKSAGDELQADLAYFAGKHLNDLAVENADLLKRASSDCRYGAADLLIDCVHARLNGIRGRRQGCSAALLAALCEGRTAAGGLRSSGIWKNALRKAKDGDANGTGSSTEGRGPR